MNGPVGSGGMSESESGYCPVPRAALGSLKAGVIFGPL